MLTPRNATTTRFTRGDARRLLIAAGILIIALTVILAIDLVPQRPLEVQAGQLATRDIVATRPLEYESAIQTQAAKDAAGAAVPFQYTYTTENAIAIAQAQQVAFEQRVLRIDTTFSADLAPDTRATLLEKAISEPELSDDARKTLKGLDPVTLGRGSERGGPGARRTGEDRAARHRRGRRSGASVGRDGRRTRRAGADARGRTDRAACHPEFDVQRGA